MSRVANYALSGAAGVFACFVASVFGAPYWLSCVAAAVAGILVGLGGGILSERAAYRRRQAERAARRAAR